MRLAVVGAFEGTHVGGSLARAAESLGVETIRIDVGEAAGSHRWLAALQWRLADHRPARLRRFSASVVDICRRLEPDAILVTGSAAVTATALRALGACGVTRLNFSTDDPWNSRVGSRWHRRALPNYDVVYTPRRSNLTDFVALGCSDVRYMPFGYDQTLFSPPSDVAEAEASDVLFVGGGDEERRKFVAEFSRVGPPITLVGGYWDRFPETRVRAIGQRGPEALRALTAAAKVNLCLVRRANRDGHVMRSFEIAAVGACMLVEDTSEHREIFGPDGDCVAYFSTPAEAAARARTLIANPAERARLARAVHQRVTHGGHTYADRLRAMLAAVAGVEAREAQGRQATV